MSVDAYFGKAQAFGSMGDEEKAIEVLQTGYEITGDSRLKEYMDKLSVGSGEEIQAGEDDDNYNAERIEELKQFLDEEWEEYSRVESACSGYIDPYTWQSYGGHLSDEQIEELCRPLVNVIEEYIELIGDVGMQSYDGFYKWEYGYDLGRFYYALGEYDKCLEVRRQWYELTGDVIFTPAEYTVEDKTDVSNIITTYDQYGNEIVSIHENFENNDTYTFEEVYTYGDNGRLSRYDHTNVDLNGIERVSTYTYLYDADGRLVEEKVESNSSDGKWYTDERKYQYMGNKVVMHSHYDDSYFGESDHYSEYEIDEYGKRTYIGDYNGNNE